MLWHHLHASGHKAQADCFGVHAGFIIFSPQSQDSGPRVGFMNLRAACVPLAVVASCQLKSPSEGASRRMPHVTGGSGDVCSANAGTKFEQNSNTVSGPTGHRLYMIRLELEQRLNKIGTTAPPPPPQRNFCSKPVPAPGLLCANHIH